MSFELVPGQVAGLLGPNGAGKTTTIRMLTGYLWPDRGRARVCGRDVVRQGRFARLAIGYLPESAPLYTEMRPGAFLEHRGRLYGLDRRRRRQRLAAVMELCGLGPVRRKRIGQLSKGYRQRVGLAAALVHNPAVLILDEPANGLDPTQIRAMRALIRELARDRTVLVSSHILSEVERTCDRVLVLADGRLLADGSPRALADRASPPGRYRVQVRTADGVGDVEPDRAGAGAADGPGQPGVVPPSSGASTLAAELRTMPGVRAVRAAVLGDGWTELAVHAQPGAEDLRTAIAERAGRAGLLPRELTRERATLDEAFAALIEQAGGAGVGPGPSTAAGVGPADAGRPGPADGSLT